MPTDAPASKPADHFEALMGAIARLQDVVCAMGPDAEIVEIRLKPSRRGRHAFECAVKSSPSFLQMALYPTLNKLSTEGAICEIMGVRVTAVDK